MNTDELSAIADMVVAGGLASTPVADVLGEAARRAVAAGLPLARITVVLDTLHPIYEGRVLNWRAGTGAVTATDYGRSDEGEAAASWRRSPLYRLHESGESVLIRRIEPATMAEFPLFTDLHGEGITGYVAMIHRFDARRVVGAMDCAFTTWATAAPGGFTEAHVAALHRLAPALALTAKASALARVAGSLVETYLGRDAGRRVLAGRIARGVAERIDAVLWFSDLRGYTRITDTAAPDQIIPLLNDYAGAIIAAIHDAGGDVLKLIGDGVLAIFTADERAAACRAALAAAGAADGAIAALNAGRGAAGLPVTEMYLGLHVGEVFYGNIGSPDRLDFTVVGPAVNEVSRIASLCRSVDQPLLASSAFAQAVADPRLVSVGRFALRGVGRAQDLFTIDPGARGS